VAQATGRFRSPYLRRSLLDRIEAGRECADVRLVSRNSDSAWQWRNLLAVSTIFVLALWNFILEEFGGPWPLDVPTLWLGNLMDSGPPLGWALLSIVVCMVPVTLIHETGHAIAARRLLGSSVQIAIGSYGEFARVRLGEISLSLNAIASPFRAGYAEFDVSEAYARDILLIALAGPAASAAGVVLSATALAIAPAHGIVHGLLWAMTCLGFVAVLNLIPLSFQDGPDDDVHETDGWVVVRAARTLYALR
jgi:hypothetical protein